MLLSGERVVVTTPSNQDGCVGKKSLVSTCANEANVALAWFLRWSPCYSSLAALGRLETAQDLN
jgi:hypothetical protein